MNITYTGISARLKNYGIEVVATAPDGLETPVLIDGSDIREFYGCNSAKWLEMHGEDESMLFELFELVQGIHVND